MVMRASIAFLTLALNVGAVRFGDKHDSAALMDAPTGTHTKDPKAVLQWMKDKWPSFQPSLNWDVPEFLEGLPRVLPHNDNNQSITYETPESHESQYTLKYFQKHAEVAWTLKYDGKHQLPWTDDYGEDMFLQYVVPMTHFDEEPYEIAYMQENLLKGTFLDETNPGKALNNAKLKDVAQYVIENAWSAFNHDELDDIKFRPNQTPKILSTSDVLENRYGSCSALSIFLANSLRSVGVPARVVGVAKWNRPEGGNHNWIEAWFEGEWHFLDAAPGEKTWDKAWFTENGQVQNASTAVGSMSKVTSPVWDLEMVSPIFQTYYPITWDRKNPNADTAGGDQVYIQAPAEDRTQYYITRKSNDDMKHDIAEHAGTRMTFTLSVVPMLVAMLGF